MPRVILISTMLVCLLTTATCLASCTSSPPEVIEIGEPGNQAEPVSRAVPVVKVVSRHLTRQIKLPGELLAYRDVQIYPKVQGFIQTITVDRGSSVKKGQTLIQIVAPELDAQCREAQRQLEAAQSTCDSARSKIRSDLAEQEEGEAKLESDEAKYKRVQYAARTPGAVAPNDLETAEKAVAADRAKVRALKETAEAAKSELVTKVAQVRAAEEALNAITETRRYLVIKAPFDGVITERNVHEGSLVSPSSSNPPMVRIQQISLLRLTVPVPERVAAGLHVGADVSFTVPAFLGKTFTGKLSRIGHALDAKTRTMPVELDVPNRTGELEPGMYPEVTWNSERPYGTLFVPASAVGSTLERTFVTRVSNGATETIDVTRGQPMGNLVEVVGNLKEGDQVVLRATDELKSGTRVTAHLASSAELNASSTKQTQTGD